MEAVSKELHKSVGTLRKWSERHGWVHRAASYDDLNIEQERQIAAIMTRERAAERVRRQAEIEDDEWELKKLAVEKVKRLLQRDDLRCTLGDVAKLMEVISKTGRLSAGLVTDRRDGEEKTQNVKVEIDVGAMVRRIYDAGPRKEIGSGGGDVVDVDVQEKSLTEEAGSSTAGG